MANDEHDYKAGPGQLVVEHPLQEEAVRQPPPTAAKKKLPALLADALDEPVFVTIDGEPGGHQARAIKMLFDRMKDAEHSRGAAARTTSMRPTRRCCKPSSSGYASRFSPSSPRSSARPPVRMETTLLRPPAQTEITPMTDDDLVEELHELKRRNHSPIPLIEMFDALLFLDPG
jgi:hypothetical protein